MRNRTRFAGILVLLFLAVFIQPSSGRPRNPSPNPTAADNPSKVVYVCACLKTKSCPCMTEAKMEGPCACGTEGGPPLKAVPQDSAWAKENRKELGR
jgi:hypothetical protein